MLIGTKEAPKKDPHAGENPLEGVTVPILRDSGYGRVIVQDPILPPQARCDSIAPETPQF